MDQLATHTVEEDLAFVAAMLLSLDKGIAGSRLGVFPLPDRSRLEEIVERIEAGHETD